MKEQEIFEQVSITIERAGQPVFVRDTVGEEAACVGGGETGERVLHLAVVAEADHRHLRRGW